MHPRVLIMHASGDASLQYIPLMNAIFSAQKAGIVVDACVLGPHDSTFLQQAAQLTNGIYLRPHNQQGLIQYMMVSLRLVLLCHPHPPADVLFLLFFQSTYLADSASRF